MSFIIIATDDDAEDIAACVLNVLLIIFAGTQSATQFGWFVFMLIYFGLFK